MVIKNPRNKYFSKKIRNTLRDRSRLKWTLTVAMIILVIVGSNLTSIYYGLNLHKSNKFMTITKWMRGLAQQRFTFVSNVIDGMQAQPEHMDIDIKFTDYQKINFQREKALNFGRLISSPDDWVPAKVRYKGETYKIDIRLKGDLADHWYQSDRMSFKIKVKNQKTLFGMSRFAIQHPRTREYLDEWYFHKLKEYWELIGLRFDFINVTLNGKDLSIYTIEENFDKRLIENNRYREGPIIRFTSNYAWWKDRGLLPIFLGASVDPYQAGRIERNEDLSNQFNIAKNLFEAFRQNKLPASKVFDVDKFARFFAIYDLLGRERVSPLEDLRFYYNPITSLIEPVGYDFGAITSLAKTNTGLMGAGRKLELNASTTFRNSAYDDGFFKDVEFFRAYIKALEEISKKSFLDEFFAKTDEEYKEKLRILHRSFPWYNFTGKSMMYNNQEYIKNFLSPPKNLLIYYDSFSPAEGLLSLQIRNIHALPVEILNVTYGETTIFKPVRETILQAAIATDPINSSLVKFSIPDNISWSDSLSNNLKVTYRILGASKISRESVFNYSLMDDNFVKEDFIRQTPNVSEFQFLTVDENTRTISFRPGSWNLATNLIIPGGYQVIANEGMTLDLSNSAKLLSYSPLVFVGSEEYPIVITSSDSTGQGVVIVNAEQESLLKYVSFHNLSNPSQNGWALTGAVTFYESPVIISHCKFIKNRCEDGLNIFRSSFEMDNTIFSETQADAFDGDFVKGKINSSAFLNCGNDAIDVSGSVLEVENVLIDGAGDKGLSAGENSRMTAQEIEIRNTELAITSKDMSEVVINRINISESRVGFSAYQKKPEFGPASITAEYLESAGVDVPYLIEQGSKMTLDNRVIEANRNNIKDILYGVEYGKSSK